MRGVQRGWPEKAKDSLISHITSYFEQHYTDRKSAVRVTAFHFFPSTGKDNQPAATADERWHTRTSVIAAGANVPLIRVSSVTMASGTSSATAVEDARILGGATMRISLANVGEKC
jgi:hypothetical protein